MEENVKKKGNGGLILIILILVGVCCFLAGMQVQNFINKDKIEQNNNEIKEEIKEEKEPEKETKDQEDKVIACDSKIVDKVMVPWFVIAESYDVDDKGLLNYFDGVNLLNSNDNKIKFVYYYGVYSGNSSFIKDEDIVEATGSVWIKEDDFKVYYKELLGEEADLSKLPKGLLKEDGYIKGGVWTGMSESYSFDQNQICTNSSILSDVIYYDRDKDDDSGKKVGIIKIDYELNNDNVVYKSIVLSK